MILISLYQSGLLDRFYKSKYFINSKNVLESEDVFSTINCLKKLGVKIIKRSKGNYLVYGKGLGSLNARAITELNFGNSGTAARP